MQSVIRSNLGLKALGILTILTLVTGCPSKPRLDPAQKFVGEYPIKATVTVGMIADLVREIGGEQVSVTQLMGAGVDPHLYKPLTHDVNAIRLADIVFYNGLLLEGKMSQVLERYGQSKRTLAVAETLPAEIIGHTNDDHESHPDPHVWMNVALWSRVAEAVRDELIAFDPDHADVYRERATKLLTKLAALHEYGVQVMACIPEEQRVLVTSHDAFRYFGEAYGIEVQAVQGISTESEAGLSRINELVDMLVTRKVSSIFAESSVPPESIEALLRGAQSRGHTVVIADSLYSDAMGTSGSYEGTYIGMMDHNLTTIARALGCDSVPAGGFQEQYKLPRENLD